MPCWIASSIGLKSGLTSWALPPEGWTRLSGGDGSTGPRWYDGRWLPLAEPQEPGWRRWLFVRRSLSLPTELTA